MSNANTYAVILPAAGRSERFGNRSKLEATLGGRAVLVRAVELFANRAEVEQVIVASDPDHLDEFKFKWGDKLGFLGATIVPGGRAERWETVANALGAVNENVTHIAVHDAARPVTNPAMIDHIFAAAATYSAVIPAVPVQATVKKIEDAPSGDTAEADPLDAILGSAGKINVEVTRVIATVQRDNLVLAQTPQVFRRDLLERAYRQIADGTVETATITDDAGLIEALGEPVYVASGDPLNVKVTVPDDLKFAEAVLMLRSGTIARNSSGSKRKFPTWAEMDDER